MPSNTDRHPKIPAQRSSDIYYAQLHRQNPHLYPTSNNPYPLPPRDDSLSYNHPTNSNQTTNTTPTAPTIRLALAASSTQNPTSPPSDAALFWSFISRQIRKQTAKSRAKKARATATTTNTTGPSSSSSPTAQPIPIIYPTSTLPQKPHSLLRTYRHHRQQKKALARKALISAPLQGGVTVVRTASGHEYTYADPRAETGVVRVLKSRGGGGTKRGRGVVMPSKAKATAKGQLAGLRAVEKSADAVAVARRTMPSEEGVVGLGIDLMGGEVGVQREEKGKGRGARLTKWGDFLGARKGEEEREGDRRGRRVTRFVKMGVDADADADADGESARDERCRICHEILTSKTKEEARRSGVCASCQSEYASPFALPDTLPPVPHLKDSRLYTKPFPYSAMPTAKTTSPPSAHPDALFADFESISSHPHSQPPSQLKYQLSPFDFQTYDADVDHQPLLSSTNSRTSPSTGITTSTRRGAVSAASPTAQTHSQPRSQKQGQKQETTYPTAPPIPEDDEYMARRYGTGRKRVDNGKGDGKGNATEEEEKKRRSSFYSFWDEVLAGTRTSLAARRGAGGYNVL